jgi:putative ABC transport system permease protein
VSLLRVAFQGVVGYWLRSLLAVVAVAAGVVGVVSVSSASSIVEDTVEQEALLLNGPEQTVDVAGLVGNVGLDRAARLSPQLERAIGGDTVATPFASLTTSILVSDAAGAPIPVTFTEPSMRRIRPLILTQGEWLPATQNTLLSSVVINSAAATALTAELGTRLQVFSEGSATPLLARVTGIANDGDDSAAAYMTISEALPLLRLVPQDVTVSIKVAGTDVTKHRVETVLARWSDLQGIEAGHTVERQDTVGRLEQEVRATTTAFYVVGCLGLFASVIAVANVGLSAMRERASEMSLRRAVGARRWFIPAIMVAESQIVAVVAAAFAVPVSFAIYPLIVEQLGAPLGVGVPPYPWGSAVLGVVVGMATCALGSLAPALIALNVRMSGIMRE